jgi:hypothetical protein
MDPKILASIARSVCWPLIQIGRPPTPSRPGSQRLLGHQPLDPMQRAHGAIPARKIDSISGANWATLVKKSIRVPAMSGRVKKLKTVKYLVERVATPARPSTLFAAARAFRQQRLTAVFKQALGFFRRVGSQRPRRYIDKS